MHTISLYAAVREAEEGQVRYFGGFDPISASPILVEDVTRAKLFTNKFDINLRPDEKMVEVIVTLSADNTRVTAPFKPRRRTDREVRVERQPGGRRIEDAQA